MSDFDQVLHDAKIAGAAFDQGFQAGHDQGIVDGFEAAYSLFERAFYRRPKYDISEIGEILELRMQALEYWL